jgi:hypothetical protein
MSCLKSLMMTMLLMVSVAPSLAQTKPPKPAVSAQSASPARAVKMEGFLARFGDTADKVKSAYHTHQEIEPPNPAWKSSQSSLWLKTEGVDYFFDEKGNVDNIRVDEPFAGKVNGVKIGDGLAQMCKAFGPAGMTYKPFQNPTWSDYVYFLGDVTVEFQLRKDEIVSAWLRDKKSQALWNDFARPFIRSYNHQMNCGALPRYRQDSSTR